MTDFSSEDYLNTSLLRFTTAGSVDDGKSTLIGRLLFDSKSIFEDQYESIRLSSERRGEDYVNLALITDGLRAEREQGITIDVAYRYFATPHRKFIIADTPGHIQYTRNMITGASTADVALILIDARKGIVEQTRRHTYLASLLRIPQVVVCINKMDLVMYDETVFSGIREEYYHFSKGMDIKVAGVIPLSALKGDNVVNKSLHMPWYEGSPLLELLESIDLFVSEISSSASLAVQYIIRPMTEKYHDYRAYAGRISTGTFRKGDRIQVQPSGKVSRIKAIHCGASSLEEAQKPMSISFELEDEIDISRGDMITSGDERVKPARVLSLMVCWLSEKNLETSRRYILRHTTAEVICIIQEILYKVDINTMEKDTLDKTLSLNEIAYVRLQTSTVILADTYRNSRETGSLILIDESTNITVAAGMIIKTD